ncbi:sulfatase [Tenacibaculum holothuriorum]|uniref:Sulfatase n=2 Tax=Tenacibaculum holothuriorum TaxID=1635173 RepID=A0A1Y2PDT5_9FLAO|nr:sulfatase [Tenacibaculum holothuriorum]
MLIDIGLYASWGARVDSTLLNYINTPKIMLASISTFELIGGILGWLLLSLGFVYIFNKIINAITFNLEKGKIWETPVFLLLFGSLIIPLRGGLQLIPINQSNVYFSKNMFANHAAVNYAWNFGNTLSHKVEDKNPYQKFDSKIAKNIIKRRNSDLQNSSLDSILKTDKPNVILIVWESLSSKVVGSIGGEPNVTENLNKLSKEGILFTNFYGNGDRTDKGLVAILSGYYPQATSSIIKMPHKTRNLPILQKEMKSIGYNTSFYYGGDINFGNINTYIRNGNIDKVVDGSEFDKENWNSKWGAHDHIFLERLSKDLAQPQQEPFFVTALTLTSHEPFEFPDTYKFGKDSEDNLYRSSQAYTDKAIGKFIEESKKQPWWGNTLVVIMSDHGHPLPKHKGYFNAPVRFQIPMLWLGGALKQKGITVNTVAAQSDFAYTLLDLLNGGKSKFTWGKNIFNENSNQYAHYIFNKGFGTVTKDGTFVYDYISNKPVIQEGNTRNLDSLGFSITQEAFQDFMTR